MSLINFPPPLSPRLNTSGFVPRLLSVFSGPSSPNVTQILPTSRSATIMSPYTGVSRPPPLPAMPMQWIWTCHQCDTTYRLAVTRRCLNDGHHFCQGSVKINRKTGRMRHYKACRTEFDYAGWSLWAEWRRDQHPDTCVDRKQRDCWNNCDYPSHCRWSDIVGVGNKTYQVQEGMEGVVTDPENVPKKNAKGEAFGDVCDAAQESLVISKTKLSASKEGFGGNPQNPDRDRDKDSNSPIHLKSPQNILPQLERSTDELLGYCEPSMDDDDSDDCQPPGAGAIAVSAFGDENPVDPATPTIPLAPLNPVRNVNLLRPTTSRSTPPNHHAAIPRVGFQGSEVGFQDAGGAFQGLPVPLLKTVGGIHRNSQDSGYGSDVRERKCDEVFFEMGLN